MIIDHLRCLKGRLDIIYCKAYTLISNQAPQQIGATTVHKPNYSNPKSTRVKQSVHQPTNIIHFDKIQGSFM